jgi:hypothetical protein
MKRSLILCVLSFLVLLAAFGGYLYWYRVVSAASKEAGALADTIAARSRAQTRIAVADSALDQLSGTEADLGAYFVAPANVVPFIEDLQSRGSATGATVSVLSVAASPSAGTGVTDPGAPLPTLTISLSITGGFDAVVRAAGAIEYAPYDLSVGSLALTESGTGTANAWTATMGLTVGSTFATTTP